MIVPFFYSTTGQSIPNYVVDQHPINWQVYFALRKVRSDATTWGSVRNGNTNVFQNQGFDGDAIDMGSLTAHLGGAAAFVDWHDQSSNDFHTTPNTAPGNFQNQPRLMTGVTPELLFNGTSNWLSGSMSPIGNPIMTFTVWNPAESSSYQYAWSVGGIGTRTLIDVARWAGSGKYYMHPGAGADIANGPVLGSGKMLITQIFDIVSPFHRVRIDGVEVTVDPLSGSINSNGVFAIGTYGPANTNKLNGTIAEWAVASPPTIPPTATIEAIENNIRAANGLL